MCVLAHVYTTVFGAKERAAGPLQLESQVVVSCLVWVTEPYFSAKSRKCSNPSLPTHSVASTL